MSVGLDVFKLGFQISPVILTGGLANSIPGTMLPIVSILQAADFVDGLLSGGPDLDLDDFFAHFEPMPGSTLIDIQVATYPFANSTTAANATIAQPLKISLLMKCPIRAPGGYLVKLATFTALQAVLAQHASSGGLYIVATPAFLYQNAILTSLRDISSGDSHQVQHTWQWDFEIPLVTMQQAQQAQNTLMSNLTQGLPTDGSLSGTASTLVNPASGAAPSVIPAAQSLSGVGAGGQLGASTPFMLGGSPVS